MSKKQITLGARSGAELTIDQPDYRDQAVLIAALLDGNKSEYITAALRAIAKYARAEDVNRAGIDIADYQTADDFYAACLVQHYGWAVILAWIGDLTDMLGLGSDNVAASAEAEKNACAQDIVCP